MENQSSKNHEKNISELVEEVKKIIRSTFRLGELVAISQGFDKLRTYKNFQNELLKIAKPINKEQLFQILEYLASIKYLSSETKIFNEKDKYPNVFFKYYHASVRTYLDAQDENTIFIARAFNDSNTKLISVEIKKLADVIGLKSIMLEDDPNIGNINSHIKNSIIKSKFVIVDITPREEKTNKDDKVYAYNPNVFFEAGIADGLNKKVIYIKNKDVELSFINQNLPFDVSSHTCIFYTLSKVDEFIDSLKKLILSVPNALT